MMTGAPRHPLTRRGLAWAVVCLALGGCAGVPGLFTAQKAQPPFRDPNLSIARAGDALTLGKSTQADVLAALGSATVIHFDSGFEVWVYRAGPAKSPAAQAEFVLLFTPSGILKKMRTRPAYGQRGD